MTDDSPNSATGQVIAVTGASGFVGRRLVRILLKRGHSVRGLTTNATKAWDVLPESDQLTLVEGDILSTDTRERLLDGANAIAHLVGIRREVHRKGITFERLHVRATTAIIESASKAGIGRFVQLSSLGTRAEAVSQYHRTKWQAECLVRESGFAWTIIRPSIIHGPDGQFIEMMKSWVTGHSPAKFVLPYFEMWEKPQDEQRPGERAHSTHIQPVYVGDVAWACAQAMETPETIGEVYPLGGPDRITWAGLMVAVRDAVAHADKNIRPWGVPVPVGLAVAHAFRAIGLESALPFSLGDVQMSAEDNSCSNVKAMEHFGFAPKPFEATLSQYADQIH